MHCAAAQAQGWLYYGGDAGGLRYSEAHQIDSGNVEGLVQAWTYRTGDLEHRPPAAMARANLEVTPILRSGRLLLCTPFNEVIALNPANGHELWRFDPAVDTDRYYGNGYTCRGVAAWRDPLTAADAGCAERVYTGTNDARLIALDATTGRPCSQFGANGTVAIDPGMPLAWSGEFQITSAPVIAGDVVIVGSSISDNARLDAPRGTVRAFDVRTGQVRWSWDPIPRDPSDPAAQTWQAGSGDTGHANVWAPMSVDEQRGLVFLPTSSPSPDFFGGLRPGDDRHANSVVALDAANGTLVWSYQLVHHDVWDYDTPAQPTLATLALDDGPRDVVIQGTKQGFVFVLDRATGEPVFPVEERPVPQGGAPGERLSPTQPMPTHVPALVPQRIGPDDAYGFTPWDRAACRRLLASARSVGLYTPPSTQGTLLFPFTGGGINWGGVAFDPKQQVLFANTSRLVHRVTLIPRAEFDGWRTRHPNDEVTPQRGTPYGMMREVLRSPLGVPCNPPPWGTLAAVDLQGGEILWESTLGTLESFTPLGIAPSTGTPSFGGPLVTGGKLVFIASTFDNYLRAFSAETGAELWQGRLPAAGQATPLTYVYEGRQYVVIAAGGRRDLPFPPGDSIVAFALPRDGEPGPSLWSRTVDRPGGRFRYGAPLIVLVLAPVTVAFVRHKRRVKHVDVSA
jgi:quinoprotein glucose dehydrogenase